MCGVTRHDVPPDSVLHVRFHDSGNLNDLDNCTCTHNCAKVTKNCFTRLETYFYYRTPLSSSLSSQYPACKFAHVTSQPKIASFSL